MINRPRILVLLGSPRRNRNSESLADSFLGPLAEVGCSITKIHVSSLQIRPCTGCDACRKTGACVLKDDMQSIYEALDQSDWVVLTSPVYFNSVTGSLKVLIDRCQIYWARKFILKHQPLKENRLGFLLMSAGVTQTQETLNGSWRVADYFFKAQDILFSELICHDKTDRDDLQYQQVVHGMAAASSVRSLPECLHR